MYTGIYEKHPGRGRRGNAISVGGKQSINVIQKGLHEKLLCQACESRMSKWETHASSILINKPKLDKLSPGQSIKVKVNYASFKLFQLSLIWRCSVSSLPTFSCVSLGHKHEARIRDMLINEKPLRYYEYPVLCIAPCGAGPFGRFIMSHVKNRKDGHIVYQYFMAGMHWIFFISGHSNNMKNICELFSLRENGELYIHVSSTDYKKFLSEVRQELRWHGVNLA